MKKFNELFREYIGYVLSVLVVLSYILTAIFTLNQTGQTVQEILVSSFIIFVLGILLSNTLGHQGINDGEKEESTLQVKKEQAKELLETQSYWYEINDFCELKNKQAMHQERERILNFAALKYADFYDEEGRFIGEFITKKKDSRYDRHIENQNKAIKRTLDIKITQITPTDLITESAKPNDPLARGRKKTEYQVQQNIKDIFVKVATALFGGLYTAQFIGAELGEIAYRIVIAIILLAFGVVRYYSNYRYIVGEYSERIQTATHWLREFKTLHEKGTFKKEQQRLEN